jgi:hypothetical protein
MLSSKAFIIRDAFVDVPEQKNTPSYNDDGQLNPRIFCEVMSDREQYKSCIESANNITCEMELLNGKMEHKYLEDFFYSYWQSHLFIATEDNEIEVYALALRFDGNDDGKTNFTLKRINKIQLNGKVLDLHITPNGMINS